MTSPRTPRQLLGWTVPEHVRFVGGQGFVTVACGTCNSVTTPALSLRDDAERIDAWLREHAHGSPRTPMGPGFCDQLAPANESKHCARPSGHSGQHRSSLVDAWDTAKWWDDDDPVPDPVLSQDVPIPLSESVEANRGEGDGTEALKARLIEALRLAAQTRPEDLGLSVHEQWYVDFNCVDCDAETLYAVLAHGLAAAGWRPPLPPWKAQLREATGHGSPEPVYTAGDLIEAYAEAERRLRAEGWTPPLPADEVEWAFRSKAFPGTVVPATVDGRETSINNGVIFANELWLIDRLREILYRPTPSDSALPAPRVFFPGDTVPAGMWVAPYGEPAPFAHGNAWTVHQYDSPVVEIHVPSREEWEATVDRAKAERVGLCDGCDSTRHPVKASDDGRAQFCPTCLPKANAPASAPGTGEA